MLVLHAIGEQCLVELAPTVGDKETQCILCYLESKEKLILDLKLQGGLNDGETYVGIKIVKTLDH
ncbi:hypothetical protein E2C01_005608 [Portunus trituberculatus]|uniref:Uncharacterized protein n=1 Tax=Portunus trituberculatus TaxID=210409 RepID=A0A5B7CZL0_PORTR|nr:hypothetical protein [Portunus trituberculatus]